MKFWIAIVLVVTVMAIVWLWEKQRSDELAMVANELGFSYQAGQHRLPDGLDQQGFYLFTQGSPYILNRLSGQWAGNEVALFGYAYAAAKGEEGMREFPNSDDDGPIEQYQQTVVWIRAEDPPLASFDLSPVRGPIRRVAGKFGLHSVGFEGREDFNRRYHLYARDAVVIRAAFSDDVLDYLLQHQDLMVECRGNQYLFYRLNKRVSPLEVKAQLTEATELLQLLSRQHSLK